MTSLTLNKKLADCESLIANFLIAIDEAQKRNDKKLSLAHKNQEPRSFLIGYKMGLNELGGKLRLMSKKVHATSSS